jgi:hypothetical protein
MDAYRFSGLGLAVGGLNEAETFLISRQGPMCDVGKRRNRSAKFS